MNTNTPYEYYKGKLGVKIKFLISDLNKDADSLCLITYRALKKRMDSDTSPEGQLRRASIGYDALIEYNSLCQEWCDMLVLKFGNPPEKIKESYFAQHYFTDGKAFDFYELHRYGDCNDISLEPEQIELYTNNASVLNTCITIKNNRKGFKKALNSTTMDIWESLSRDVNNFNVVKHNLPKHKDSLRRKVLEYQKEGYKCLISGRLQNKNARKVVTDEQTSLLDELLGKHNNLDNEIICTMYNAVAKQLGWKVITAGTVANRKKEREIVVFAGRNGVTDLRDTILMQNKRMKPSAPLLFWTLDGWDVELMYQKTERNTKGHKVTTYTNRVNAVIVLDPYNYYPVGYAIGTHETPELIQQALLNAMQHTKELFGEYYKPYQLQSDNYGGNELKKNYAAICKHYTPARVKNAKSKTIEPWFNRFNKKHCRLANNWSGYNVDSGSKNQPNTEFLDKIKHSFPDYKGVCQQIESMIGAERKELLKAYLEGFDKTPKEHIGHMDTLYLLDVLGLQTERTCKLEGQGITPVLLGEERCYDSFDIGFRMLFKTDWQVRYNPYDLKEILVVSSDHKHKHLLQEKYIQPMALYDRKEGDAAELQKIYDYNASVEDYIIEERAKSSRIVSNMFNQYSALDDTLAKHVLTDSLGQHKNRKSASRLQVAKAIEVTTVKNEEKKKKDSEATWISEQEEYLNGKVDINKYLK
ncbi:hypothetical protein [Elizabethkingia miricola]|uniref:hypothetical protein n=1 Tax=Elizabethkingia miricola TaxID=172045 RepID=UPI000B3633C5|nr:hypothetical protein [Elizabethkingia miricola]